MDQQISHSQAVKAWNKGHLIRLVPTGYYPEATNCRDVSNKMNNEGRMVEDLSGVTLKTQADAMKAEIKRKTGRGRSVRYFVTNKIASQL